MIQLMGKLGNKELCVVEDKDIVSPENIENLFLSEGAVGHFRSTMDLKRAAMSLKLRPVFSSFMPT
jgi:hypothetical protein